MNEHESNHPVFITLVRTPYGKNCARLLIESLRSFGGKLQNSPFWLAEANPHITHCSDMENLGVKVLNIDTPQLFHQYFLGDKVYACAQVESLVHRNTQSMVWIDPNCLIVQPPLLYALNNSFDAAFRPVHIRNVGSPINQPLDAFWKRVYETVGINDIEMQVESFVDSQPIRAYFNSHAFAINPSLGLMKRWLAHFETLINDREFQSGACQDDDHQTFLFQAVLSSVVVSAVETQRLRLLPPEYNYPYNLQELISIERRAKAFNDLVSFTYENLSLKPQDVKNIEVREPLLGWLLERVDNLPPGV